jgi:hypothetical protein
MRPTDLFLGNGGGEEHVAQEEGGDLGTDAVEALEPRAPARTPALDVCPVTGRARLSYRRRPPWPGSLALSPVTLAIPFLANVQSLPCGRLAPGDTAPSARRVDGHLGRHQLTFVAAAERHPRRNPSGSASGPAAAELAATRLEPAHLSEGNRSGSASAAPSWYTFTRRPPTGTRLTFSTVASGQAVAIPGRPARCRSGCRDPRSRPDCT